MKTHYSMSLFGISPVLVTVRAERSEKFEVVGLREAEARETRVRVLSAISALAPVVTPPKVRVTIENKSGPCDLAVAVAVLDAAGVLDENLPQALLLGELGLDGRLRGVRGLYPMLVEHVSNQALPRLVIVPACQESEAGAVDGPWLAARDLQQVFDLFRTRLSFVRHAPPVASPSAPVDLDLDKLGDKVLLVGPPGAGKTVLARKIAASLPAPSGRLAEEVLSVRSAAGLWDDRPLQAPFRAPHHTVSEAGLLGGGARPRPGEVSLAHGGVLFLDEVAEFRRSSLEDLARVVGRGEVVLARSEMVARMPARPALVVGSCEPRDFERAKKLFPWTGVYEMTAGEVGRLAEVRP